jgi:hypothetical protein
MRQPLSRINFLIVFSAIVCGAVFIQYAGVFNSDVSWLMQCTQQWLHGGKYYTDFFETNPPMILYLYIPPVVISHFFHASIILTAEAYFFLLAFFSLAICSLIVRKIFTLNSKFNAQIFMLAMTFVFLIFPVDSLGQREHIALMLVMPYLLLSALRLGNAVAGKWIIVTAGIMSGLGFAIKPHFLVPLILVEFYLMIKKRRVFYWMRTESIIILSLLVLYLLSIFMITPEYIYKILPLIWPLYSGSMTSSWPLVLSQSAVMFFLITTGFYFNQKHCLQHKSLANVLMVSTAGFFIVYLLQKTPWFYHTIPFVGLAIILAALIFADLLTKDVSKSRHQVLSNKVQAGILFLFVFIFVTTVAANLILTENDYKTNKMRPFQEMIKMYGGERGSVYFLTVAAPAAYPLVTYAKVESVSRLPFFCILPELVRRLSIKPPGIEKRDTLKQKKEFINIITEDLAKKPALLFVEQVPGSQKHSRQAFNYISFFSENSEFKRLFQQYHYVGHISVYDVYQSNSVKAAK